MANTTKNTTAKKRATSTAKMSGASMSAKGSASRNTARRNNNTTNKRNNSDSEKPGFTIIEVVLVLAIAGLIFLMVFIALPQLQRAQRDTQRRNDLARVSEAITSYQTNNNGKIPGTSKVDAAEPGADGKVALPTCTGTGVTASTNGACRLIVDYLHRTGATENEFVDPDGTGYGIVIEPFASMTSVEFNHMIHVVTKAKCDGESVVSASSTREYAVTYKLEGNGTYCQDNGS